MLLKRPPNRTRIGKPSPSIRSTAQTPSWFFPFASITGTRNVLLIDVNGKALLKLPSGAQLHIELP
jgi:hypothetical protein